MPQGLDRGILDSAAQSKRGAAQVNHRSLIRDPEVLWWEEEEDNEDTVEDLLPEGDIATLSQVMSLIIGEPVSVGQVSQALRKVTSQEEEQDDPEILVDNEQEDQEEERGGEEGAMGSVGNRRGVSITNQVKG